MISMAEQICLRMTGSGKAVSDNTIVSRRENISAIELLWPVEMDSIMACVHRLQHINRFAAADLADDDAIGPHPKRGPNQLPDRDLTLALHIRIARFKTDEIIQMKQSQFRRILDGDDPFILGDAAGQRIQQRRLRCRPSADEDVISGSHDL